MGIFLQSARQLQVERIATDGKQVVRIRMAKDGGRVIAPLLPGKGSRQNG